jgi:hypothetical protein
MLFSLSDLSAMKQPFETEITVNKGYESEWSLSGIVDTPADDFNIDHADYDYSGRKATVTCLTTEANKLKVGKSGSLLLINGINYRVSDINPDESEEGYSIVELKKP